MATETVLDFARHLLSVLYEDADLSGMRRILQKQVLLNRLDVGQQGLSQDFDAMERDDGFERPDDSIDRPGDVEAARGEACGKDEDENDDLLLHPALSRKMDSTVRSVVDVIIRF